MTEKEQPDLAPQTHPLAVARFIEKAIESKLPAEELGKLIDLAERLEKNRAVVAFNVAMNEAQTEMPVVVRNALNKQLNKSYAPVETVQETIRQCYTKHGFSLSFTSEAGSHDGLYHVHLDIGHREGHTKRVTLPNVPLDDKGPKGGDVKTQIQGQMSSMSYAQGRLIRMGFNITVADEDRDGQPAAGGSITEAQLKELSDLVAEYRHGFQTSHKADEWFESWMQWIETACKRKIEKLEDLTEQQATFIIKGTKDLVAARRKK